jgi:hypothetical protein
MKKTAHRPHPTILVLAGLAYLRDMNFRARQARRENPEAGNVITDNLAWIVFGVVAIVAIGALISGLGKDVINWTQNQLGV